MAEGVNVRFAGELQFVQQRTSASGPYSSASESIRDLLRHEYECEEQRKWQWLRQELQAGATADDSEFVALDADSIIGEAKKRRKNPWPLRA